MATRTYRSFAKINLHLQVDGRYPDGYHRLTTIFQTVSLHDLISLEILAEPTITLRVPGGGAPEGEGNLAWRAAHEALNRWAPGRGARIEIRKRIPSGGGLGGGSSNAAVVLSAIPEILGVTVDPSEMTEVARTLGADVPFFLVGGTALGTGRGDEISPLPDLEEQEVVLVNPGISVSTAEIFGALELPEGRANPAGLLSVLESGSCVRIADLDAFNDLEEPVLERVPEVRSVYTALRQAGATCVRLSGSGGTVFACFAPSRRGREVELDLPDEARVYAARTVSRAALNEARSAAGEGD